MVPENTNSCLALSDFVFSFPLPFFVFQRPGQPRTHYVTDDDLTSDPHASTSPVLKCPVLHSAGNQTQGFMNII